MNTAYDSTDAAMAFAQSVWDADATYAIQLETNRLNFQIAWRREELAKLAPNDPNRTKMLAEIAQMQSVSLPTLQYVAAGNAAQSNWFGASLTAYTTYQDDMVDAIDAYMEGLNMTEYGYAVGSQAALLNLESNRLASDQIRALALFEASKNEDLENAMTELAVAQSLAASSQSAANRSTFLMAELETKRKSIGSDDYTYNMWKEEVDEASTEIAGIKSSETAARPGRISAGNATIAAAKTANAAAKLEAEQEAEVQYKNDTVMDEVSYLATIFDLEIGYINGLLANFDTGQQAAMNKYLASMKQADRIYDNEICRLDGRFSDVMNSLPSGGTVEADFYENGATSVNVQVCFGKEFQIKLADGTTKQLGDFEGGEEFWSRPHDNPEGPLQKCKVVRVFKNGVKETMLVKFDNGLELRGTAEHPFWVQGKGWIPLGELTVGDTCLDREQNPVIVKEIIRDAKEIEVFNIEVEGCHTYYIGNGKQEVLVHNECPVCHGSGTKTIPASHGVTFGAMPSTYYSPEVTFTCPCKGGPGIKWRGKWTDVEKQRVIESVLQIREEIDKHINGAEEIKNLLTDEEYKVVKKDVEQYIDLLKKIKLFTYGHIKITFRQGHYVGKEPESPPFGVYFSPIRRYVLLNINPKGDWHTLDLAILSGTVYHEVSHHFGTHDGENPGYLKNAHTITERYEGKKYGSIPFPD